MARTFTYNLQPKELGPVRKLTPDEIATMEKNLEAAKLDAFVGAMCPCRRHHPLKSGHAGK